MNKLVMLYNIILFCFDVYNLIKNCEFIKSWLFSEENATIGGIWEIQ